MGITGMQMAQNYLDHPRIRITWVSVTDGPLYKV
jgi:hypothetical protein